MVQNKDQEKPGFLVYEAFFNTQPTYLSGKEAEEFQRNEFGLGELFDELDKEAKENDDEKTRNDA